MYIYIPVYLAPGFLLFKKEIKIKKKLRHYLFIAGFDEFEIPEK